MSRGSFGRSVARAAASGGGKAYRARRPVAWYLMMIAICVVGTSLIVYSRQERLHPPAAKAAEGPAANDHWYVALGIDICGTVQPNLPKNPNLTSTGLRTFGDGLINIEPAAATSGKPANFEGAKATLSNFAAHYPGFTLTRTSIKLPGQKTTYTDGYYCIKRPSAHPTLAQQRADEGQLFVEEWKSPTAVGHLLTTADPTKLHLTNGAMVTIAFVTVGQKIPEPTSKPQLVQALGTTTSATTTTAGSGATTTTTAATTTTGATTTTVKSGSTTT